MDLDLTDKVALITGPAKGMGAAITRAFAHEGCRLSLIGRDTTAIAPIAAEIGEPLVLHCDLTDPAQCAARRSPDTGPLRPHRHPRQRRRRRRTDRQNRHRKPPPKNSTRSSPST